MNYAEFYKQMSYRARFEWGYDGIKTHGQVSDILVIIDVLSFTTCVDVVLGQGGIVYPYRTKGDSALAFARKQDAILAGKRGEPISLSPASLHSIKWGSRIVLPSPNGSTCSVLAKDCGAIVLAGCLRNAKAVARYIQQHSGSVSVIACGERWPNGNLRPALEDLVAAGAILRELSDFHLSPEAEAAVATFSASQYKLESILKQSVSGQELIVRGYPDDIHLASMLNVSQMVPLLNHQYAFENAIPYD